MFHLFLLLAIRPTFAHRTCGTLSNIAHHGIAQSHTSARWYSQEGRTGRRVKNRQNRASELTTAAPVARSLTSARRSHAAAALTMVTGSSLVSACVCDRVCVCVHGSVDHFFLTISSFSPLLPSLLLSPTCLLQVSLCLALHSFLLRGIRHQQRRRARYREKRGTRAAKKGD